MGQLNLDHTYLRSILSYDEMTGRFTWLVNRRGMTERNPVAGGVISRGYRAVRIDGHRHLEHRLVWFYVHGEWPKHQIDHINGIKTDNRLCNLREATNSQNNANVRIKSNNKSGHRGVFWNTKHGKWQASVGYRSRSIYVGLFDDLGAAVSARNAAAVRLHGDFARTE